MPTRGLAGSSGGALLCYSGLFALLMRRLWRVRVAASTHRRQLHTARAQRAWVALVSTWHTPLLMLGLLIAASRICCFLEIYAIDKQPTVSANLRRLQWLLLELPSALLAILAAYLLFFHAHVVYFRVWPIRFESTALSFRVLLGFFSVSILSVVALTSYAREDQDPMLNASEWMRFELKYFGVVWIVLGAMLLKFQSASAEVQWMERDAGRLLIVSPRGVHKALVAQTLLSLALVLRGIMYTMLAVSLEDDPLLPENPWRMELTTFISMFGVWELLTIGVIDQLCSCVPVTSRARRLAVPSSLPETQAPIVSELPAVHLAVRSPREAVEDYLRSGTLLLESRSRLRRHDSFNSPSSYEPAVGLEVDVEDDDMVGGDALATAHEPLLSLSDSDEDDDDEDRRPLVGQSSY